MNQININALILLGCQLLGHTSRGLLSIIRLAKKPIGNTWRKKVLEGLEVNNVSLRKIVSHGTFNLL